MENDENIKDNNIIDNSELILKKMDFNWIMLDNL